MSCFRTSSRLLVLITALTAVTVVFIVPPATAGDHASGGSAFFRHGLMAPRQPVKPPTVPSAKAGKNPMATPPSCSTRVFPDPGHRPLWVPGTPCWTGSGSVWIPGHWLWEAP